MSCRQNRKARPGGSGATLPAKPTYTLNPYLSWQGGADGNGRVWLDNVKCSGEEGGIDLCDHDPWGYDDPTPTFFFGPP